jgi:acyl carrier protein
VRHEAELHMSGQSALTNEPKRSLAKLWSELLEIPQEAIAGDSNFLFLGGDSVSLLTLQIRIAGELGVEIPAAMLYANLEFREMLNCIADGSYEKSE